MRVASFCSLPFAIIPWAGAEPMLSVVVKATFSLAADGEATLASEQEPLRIDEPDPLSDAAGLRYASDFAPQKARADVLVVGHAHAPSRVNTIPIRMTFDVLDKHLVARSAEATTRIPLVPRHLRTNEATNASPVAVGPRSAWSPERIGFGGAELGGHGAPLHPLGEGFDFQFFNAAPLDQQVGVLRPNAAMTLDGLMPGGGRRQAWLPGHRPRVFHFGERGPGDHAAEIPLACDTLWIDTDRAICALVWRGVLARSRAAEPPAVFVVSLEPRGAARGWPLLRDALSSARWERGLLPGDFSGEGKGADELDASSPPRSLGESKSDALGACETLTEVRPWARERTGASGSVPEVGVTLPLSAPVSLGASPPSSGDAPTQPDSGVPGTGPFAPLFMPKDGGLDLAVPSSGDPWEGATEKYLPIQPPSDDEPTLLRAAKRGGDDDCATLPANASLGSEAPTELLSIDAYADLQVELSMGRRSQGEVLAARGVSLATFRAAERHYAAALAAEAAGTGLELSNRLDAALDRARQRLAERSSGA